MKSKRQTSPGRWKASVNGLEQKFPRLFAGVFLTLAAALMAGHYTFGEWIHNSGIALWKEPAFWADVPKYIVWPFALWGGWYLISLGRLKTPKFLLALAALICLGDVVWYVIPIALRGIENSGIYRFNPSLDKWHWFAYWYRWAYWMPTALIIGNLVLLKRWWRLVIPNLHFRKTESAGTNRAGRSRFPGGLAVLMIYVVCVLAVLCWGLPRFPANQDIVALVRDFLVKPRLRNDFDYLIQNSFSDGQRLAPLLTQLKLADRQRHQFYPDLDNATFQKYVLSPEIAPLPLDEVNWRRTLWKFFYPKIRHKSDPVAAARIVVRSLREQVGIDPGYDYRVGVETIWTEQMTDQAGFQRIYVAALRSVGIAARLNGAGQAELLESNEWQPAPRVLISTFEEKKFPVPRGGLVNWRNWAGNAWP